MTAVVPADESYHRFAMLERSIRNFARRDAFEQATRLYRELLEMERGEPRYSKLKVRFGAELAKLALGREKRQVAEEILMAAETGIAVDHLDASDRDLIERVRVDLRAL